MKITQTPTERMKITGPRGRTIIYLVDKYEPDQGQSWWIWAGRVSTYLLAMTGVVIFLIVAGVAL